jgi:hypothetical protein
MRKRDEPFPHDEIGFAQAQRELGQLGNPRLAARAAIRGSGLGGLFLPLSFIQLREKRQHFARQILWNFIARSQLMSDHCAHGTTNHCFRPGHVIQFIA